MSRIRTLICALLSIGALLAVTPAAVYAEADNGYKISPVRTDLTISPGTAKTVQVYVTNVTQDVENLQAEENDFTTNNENGGAALYLNGQAAPSHSLKPFVQISNPQFSLQPGQQQTITATITIPANAKPGGYFGAVRIVPAAVNGGKNVNLSASVASLVLVTVPGNYVEKMSLASMDVLQNGHQRTIFSSGKNLQVAVRFNNTGDVQEQPFGKILLLKGSKTLYSAEINNTDPRGNVLPDSIRKFTVNLSNVGGFGKYTIEGNFGYGKDQLVSGKTTFYVIPYGAIAVIVLILLVIAALILAVPRFMRRHDQKVLRRSGRR